MSGDRSLATPLARAEALQTFLCERESKLGLPDKPMELFREMFKRLVDAHDQGWLKTKHHEIHERLKMSDSPLGKSPEYTGIYGGEKDLKRTGKAGHFLRADGAWFVFTITVRSRHREPLELIAYDFELCFPAPVVQANIFPRFVRFDLNQPEHGNELKGLRCHTHPGHDDLIAPAPLMSPLDLLDLFLEGLLVPEHPRKA